MGASPQTGAGGKKCGRDVNAVAPGSGLRETQKHDRAQSDHDRGPRALRDWWIVEDVAARVAFLMSDAPRTSRNTIPVDAGNRLNR